MTNFLQPRRNFDPSLGEIMDQPQAVSKDLKIALDNIEKVNRQNSRNRLSAFDSFHRASQIGALSRDYLRSGGCVALYAGGTVRYRRLFISFASFCVF